MTFIKRTLNTRIIKRITAVVALVVVLGIPLSVHAENPTGTNTSTRSKSLSFEDSVVEGLNKNPLDSLEQVSKQDGRKQPALYQKRRQYRMELKNCANEIGVTQ